MACTLDGNSDMYGLGIRLAFYIQWYGAILAAWIAPGEVNNLRLSNIFFSAATLLATIIQVSEGNGLKVVEIYVILLFNFHSALYLLPVLLYRFVTGFDPRWDFTRFPRAPPASKVSNDMNIVLLMVVMTFQIWFWCAKVPSLDKAGCESYGFLFHKFPLRTLWFRLFHSIVSGCILAFLVYLLVPPCTKKMKRKRQQWDEYGPDREKEARVLIFQILDTLSRLFMSTSIIVGTELTIHWNHIAHVDSVKTAGQLIPLCVAAAAVVRMIYKAIERLDGDSELPGGLLGVLSPWNNVRMTAGQPSLSSVDMNREGEMVVRVLPRRLG